MKVMRFLIMLLLIDLMILKPQKCDTYCGVHALIALSIHSKLIKEA